MKKISFVLVLALIFTNVFCTFSFAQSPDELAPIPSIETSNVITPQSGINFYRFFKTSETISQTVASMVKVSADLTGPGTIQSTVSKTISATYSSSLASNNKGLIQATVSASYGVSLTNTLGYTLSVDAGKTGYMAFQPYTVIVKGDLKYYSSVNPNTPLSSTAVTAKFPKKLSSGFSDGRFYIKYL